MSASNFIACFNQTESFEGSYVDNPHDPGGATDAGVTQAVYSAYLRSKGRPDAPVKGISLLDRQTIYHDYFWNAVHGDDLCNGLDLVMVDTCWGSGPVEAIKFLQRRISVTDDGVFGPQTMAALAPHMIGAASTTLIQQICDERLAFFQSLSTWQYFGKGWTNRLNGIHAKALAMNAAALASQSVANIAPAASASPGATSPKDMSTMTTPSVSTTTAIATATAPNVAPPVTVDAGDTLVALIQAMEPIAANAAATGIQLVAGSIPGGGLILDFFGTSMVKQYVASAAVQLEALAKKDANFTINPSNALESMVLGAINSELAPVEAFFGPKLKGWISAEVSALLAKLPKPAPLNPSGAIGS